MRFLHSALNNGLWWAGTVLLIGQLFRDGLWPFGLGCLAVGGVQALIRDNLRLRRKNAELLRRTGARLKPVEWGAVIRTQHTKNGTRIEDEWSLNVRLRNEPQNELPESVAENVLATILWVENGKIVLKVDGRWGSSTEPPFLPPGTHISELLPINFGIGAIQDLNFAIADIAPISGFYAFNNESYFEPRHRKPEFFLGGTSYTAIVRLYGTRANEEFRFRVTRDFSKGFAITRLPPLTLDTASPSPGAIE